MSIISMEHLPSSENKREVSLAETGDRMDEAICSICQKIIRENGKNLEEGQVYTCADCLKAREVRVVNEQKAQARLGGEWVRRDTPVPKCCILHS